MDHEECRLTRADFDTHEDWLRYCWEGGLDPIEDMSEYRGVNGVGHHTILTAAVYGHDQREYQFAWQERGKSYHVEPDDLTQVYRAIALANCRGSVLNTKLDITWSTVGITNPFTIRRLFREFLDWLRRWLQRHAGWPAFVWVFERGKTFGLHTHMPLYVPFDERLEFIAAAKGVLSKIIGAALLDTSTSETMQIRVRRDDDVTGQWTRFRYLMKGIDPLLGWQDRSTGEVKRVAKRLSLRWIKDGGTIDGKRVGVSRELDQASYERWAATNPLPDMKIGPWGADRYGNQYLNWHIEHWDTLVDPRDPKTEAGLQT